MAPCLDELLRRRAASLREVQRLLSSRVDPHRSARRSRWDHPRARGRRAVAALRGVRGLIRAVDSFSEKSMRLHLATLYGRHSGALGQGLNGTISTTRDDSASCAVGSSDARETVTDGCWRWPRRCSGGGPSCAHGGGSGQRWRWRGSDRNQAGARSLTPRRGAGDVAKALEDLANLTGTDPPEPVGDPGDPVANGSRDEIDSPEADRAPGEVGD